MRFQLIYNWEQAYKLHSVQVAGVAGALAAGLAVSAAVVPWMALIPVWAVFAGGALVCVLTIIARLNRQ